MISDRLAIHPISEIASGSNPLPKFRPFSLSASRGRKAKWATELGSIILTMAIILAGAILYVWQHIQVIRLGYRVEELNTELSALIQEERELTVKIAQLKSLARIEEIARRKLGMVDIAPSQIIIVSPERHSAKVQSAPKGRKPCVQVRSARR